MDELRKAIEKNMEEFGFPVTIDERLGTLQWVDMRELRLRYVICIENIMPFFEGMREGK